MRSIGECINRVKCGQQITDEETAALDDWLDKKKRSQSRFYRYLIIAAFLVFAGALFLPSFAFAYGPYDAEVIDVKDGDTVRLADFFIVPIQSLTPLTLN